MNFELSRFVDSTLGIPGSLAFQWITGLSLVGFAIPVFAAIAIRYDWSREYDVPALKRFLKRYGLIVATAIPINAAVYFSFPTEAGIVFVATVVLIGMMALGSLEQLRKSNKP